MATIFDFGITTRWPPSHPEYLQLYSTSTPNGLKVLVMLEELRLPYEFHLIDLQANETRTSEFLSINPNGKIPLILDPNGPDGQPLALFESGAILIYLSEKCGMLMPDRAAMRYETIQWVFFQMASIGPMFGQMAFFHQFGGRAYEDKRPRDRYAAESARILRVLETHLDGREFIMGDAYTIADISMIGWVRNITGLYDAGDLVEYGLLVNVPKWLERCLMRPAVQRALVIKKERG
jgi:GST-like protein